MLLFRTMNTGGKKTSATLTKLAEWISREGKSERYKICDTWWQVMELYFSLLHHEKVCERKKGLFYLKPHKESCTLKFVTFSRQYISDMGQHFFRAGIKNHSMIDTRIISCPSYAFSPRTKSNKQKFARKKFLLRLCFNWSLPVASYWVWTRRDSVDVCVFFQTKASTDLGDRGQLEQSSQARKVSCKNLGKHSHVEWSVDTKVEKVA